jgi:hypothetical protein
MIQIKIAFAVAAGFFVLLPACLLHAWTGLYPSIKPLPNRTYVDVWRWQWLNYWYANSEDGVSGQQALVWTDANTLVWYPDTFPHWTPKWWIAYCWSAWRNNANNLKRPLRSDYPQPWRPVP